MTVMGVGVVAGMLAHTVRATSRSSAMTTCERMPSRRRHDAACRYRSIRKRPARFRNGSGVREKQPDPPELVRLRVMDRVDRRRAILGEHRIRE